LERKTFRGEEAHWCFETNLRVNMMGPEYAHHAIKRKNKNEVRHQQNKLWKKKVLQSATYPINGNKKHIPDRE